MYMYVTTYTYVYLSPSFYICSVCLWMESQEWPYAVKIYKPGTKVAVFYCCFWALGLMDEEGGGSTPS